MNSSELRAKYLKFFEDKGHKVIPSASLVPANDPTVLFTTAGMQQFKAYYLDPENAPAKNVVSIQKCLRTSSIEEVGDDTHLTFFEMLGNFSFGGYWKDQAIKLAWDFITKELAISKERIHVTIFDGVPLEKDIESYEIWKKLGLEEDKIKTGGIEDNFWGPTGLEGPCGPSTEIYVDGIEVWNIVFNEFYSKTSREQAYQSGWHLDDLQTKGIDTGMGLERLAAIVQGKNNIFETDLFEKFISSLPQESSLRKKRILADHIRAISFLISDGIRPSNKGAGYVLRRLLRRILAQYEMEQLKHATDWITSKYRELPREDITRVIDEERKQFIVALHLGVKELNKLQNIDSQTAFRLYSSYGLPIDVIKDKFPDFDAQAFDKEFEKHQELSRTSSAGQFKGGLASSSDKVVRLHTATHLMNAALRKVLGDGVWQKGSNITEERTRFDFTHGEKMTDDQKQEVEKLVNEWIERDLTVVKEILPLEKARELGAIGVFGEKYPDTVSVYTIYDDEDDELISREFCGGPHVEHTGVIGKFKIQKEEAVSAGVRRIKAVIE